jgi:hypothetical protein
MSVPFRVPTDASYTSSSLLQIKPKARAETETVLRATPYATGRSVSLFKILFNINYNNLP